MNQAGRGLLRGSGAYYFEGLWLERRQVGSRGGAAGQLPAFPRPRIEPPALGLGFQRQADLTLADAYGARS